MLYGGVLLVERFSSVSLRVAVYVDYRVTTEGDDGSVSENPQVVVDRLVEIAHEVLDDSPHCEGFTVRAQAPAS